MNFADLNANSSRMMPATPKTPVGMSEEFSLPKCSASLILSQFIYLSRSFRVDKLRFKYDLDPNYWPDLTVPAPVSAPTE
jgi:hypothetical protein